MPISTILLPVCVKQTRGYLPIVAFTVSHYSNRLVSEAQKLELQDEWVSFFANVEEKDTRSSFCIDFLTVEMIIHHILL